MAVVVKTGESFLGESPLPHARWVENPAEAAVFVDVTAANAYAAARAVTFGLSKPTVSGIKHFGKRELT